MKIQPWAGVIAGLLSMALLAGCGGGGSSGNGNVRLVNATHDYGALDLYTSTTEQVAGVAESSVSSYVGLSEGSYNFQIKPAGSSTTALYTTLSVGKDTSYSIVAFNTGTTISLAYFTDNQGAPTAGTAALRMFDGAALAGNLDVYITSPDADLATATATQSKLSGGVSAYNEVTAGTYRIRVTGNGNKSDLRLDIPSITLNNQQIATLLLTPTSGGTLVNGLLLNQGGSATPYTNASARVRVVSAVTGNGSVSAATTATTLASGLLAPSVGSYITTPASLAGLTLSVNGSAVDTSAVHIAAGEDASVLVYGNAAAPQLTVLHDDNTASSVTGEARLRLVNLVNGLSSPASLAANYLIVADNVAVGQASAPTSITGASGMRLEATTPVSSTPLYLATDVTLAGQAVYTVFLLGDVGAPVGKLVRDR